MTDHAPHEDAPMADRAPSRRAVLRSAAVAGSLVWAAPVVQTLTPSAFAAGSPGAGTGLSYVGVILRAPDGTQYRVKWEFGDDGRVSGVESGRTWNAGFCANQPGAGRGEFFYRSATPYAAAPPAGLIRSAVGSRQGFQLTVAPGVVLVDWIVHQGQCCLRKSSATATTQTGPLGSKYVVTVSPGLPAGSGNSAFTFPGAPNKAPCQLV